jgi:hypothetical protein
MKKDQAVTVSFKLEELKEHPSMHDIHRGKSMEPGMDPSPESLDCTYCHATETSNYSQKVPAMSVCKDCHADHNAPQLGCTQCHLGTTRVLSGIRGAGIGVIKSNMADHDCIDCHDPQNKLQVQTEVCLKCHEDSYREKLGYLQKEYMEKVNRVKKHYNQINNNLRLIQGKHKNLINPEELRKGEYNYKYALLDRSRGVHNNEFVMQLLNEAERILSKLKDN